MHILMLSADRSGLQEDSSTVERWCALVRSGIELTVLIPSTEVVDWSKDGIRVIGCGGVSRIERYKNLYRVAKEIKADLITAQDPLELGWIAYLVSRKTKVPFEVQDHGGFFDGGEITEPYWKLRSLGMMFLARRARQIRTVSPASAERLRTLGYRFVRLAPIPANEQFKTLERQPERGLIVAVGRLVKVKQFDRLLRAFKQSLDQGTATKLEIMGDGPERANLEAYAEALGITSHVHFLGQGDIVALKRLLSRASVFALFSQHEGWGVAWVEAALARVPVVMTDTGCARWLESQHCAVISRSEHEDAEAIALAMHLPMPRLSGELVPTIQESAYAQVQAWKETLKPRLLVLMQAVDLDDKLVGYFVEWLKKAKQFFGGVSVLGLRVGRHDLPPDIKVMPMRPKGSSSKFRAFVTVIYQSYSMRFQYDGVFLRGDAMYAVLFGWFWRLLGKRIVLWYAHYKPNSWLSLAEKFAHIVTSSVPEAYPDRPKAIVQFLGQGIDSSRFALSHTHTDVVRMLVLGRVQKIKGTKEIVEMFIREGGFGRRASLTIIGPALESDYEQEMEKLIQDQPDIRWVKGLPYDEIPEALKAFDVLVNAYPGSLDKVIVESMMTGLIPVVATKGLAHTLPSELRWLIASTDEERTKSLRKIVNLAAVEREKYAALMRELALRDHSMEGQLDKLAAIFKI